jgi:hypothetical protein
MRLAVAGRPLVDKVGADGVDHFGRDLPPRDGPRVVASEEAGDPDQRLGLRPTAARLESGHVKLSRRASVGREARDPVACAGT